MIWHDEEKILYESFYEKPNRGKLRERMAETPESSAKWAVAGCTKGRNVSREHGKISLSEAALGRRGARSVHAGAAGKRIVRNRMRINPSHRVSRKNVSRGTLRNFYGSCPRGQEPARAAPCRRARQSVLAQTAQPEGDGFGGAAAPFLVRPMMAVMDFLGQSMRDSVR